MSKVTEAKYTHRYNLGEYNYEEYTLTAVAEDRDTGSGLLLELKEEVNKAHAGEATEAETKTEKKDKTTKEKKNGKRKSTDSDDETESKEAAEDDASESDDEGDSDNEASDGEAGDDANDSTEEGEAEGDEQEEEEQPKKVAGKKGFKKKPQHYDRKVEAHKEKLSGLLKSVSPNWNKTDAGKAAAKSASKELEGEPFLDENGEILDSFKSKLKKLMPKARK